MSGRDRARITALSCVTLVLLGVAQATSAQRPGPHQEVTVSELALDWARGRFATPVVCQFDGKAVRGLRRILITPGPSHVRPAVDRIVFVDMEVSDASRCVIEIGGEVPNVMGSIQIRLPSARRPDTARRDFREHLRRKNGFDFDIVAGGLRLQPVTQPESPARSVDFRGGEATLRTLDMRTDAGRLLAPFDSPRKLMLELSARDGTKLSFPLYMTDLR